MRQLLVAGNWKLNGSLENNQTLIGGILKQMGSVVRTQVVVCVPYVYLAQVADLLKGSEVKWGSQNVSDKDSGAYTGEVSAPMLKEFSCSYVIVGHSERRSIYKESDEEVANKFAAVQNAGLIPILCVGELLEERESGVTEAVVGRQIDAVLNACGVNAMANSVIAYEPVWAIGTGKTATPDQAQDVHAFIRSKIASQNNEIAENLQILYGGSVKGSNAAELFAKADIDGGLIGGASLKADDFMAICSAG